MQSLLSEYQRDVLLCVFSHVPLKDLFALSRVSKFSKKIATEIILKKIKSWESLTIEKPDTSRFNMPDQHGKIKNYVLRHQYAFFQDMWYSLQGDQKFVDIYSTKRDLTIYCKLPIAAFMAKPTERDFPSCDQHAFQYITRWFCDSAKVLTWVQNLWKSYFFNQ